MELSLAVGLETLLMSKWMFICGQKLRGKQSNVSLEHIKEAATSTWTAFKIHSLLWHNEQV